MFLGGIAIAKLLEGLLVVTLLTGGQVFFKLAATAVGSGKTIVPFLLSLAQTGWFWVALSIYGIATILWISMLTRYSLSASHGILALSYVAVPLVGMLWLGEPFRASVIVALGFILMGVFILITFSS